MTAIFLAGQRPVEYRLITLHGHGTFEIEITAPSFADRLKDNELLGYPDAPPGSWIEHRLRTAVTGWRGLSDHYGESIVFVWEALQALCEQYPDAFPQIVKCAHEAYKGLAKDAVKNSAGPASPPSAEAA